MVHAINDYQQQRNVSGEKTSSSFRQAFQANQPSYIELGDSNIEQPDFYQSFSKKASRVEAKSVHENKRFFGVSASKVDDVQKQPVSAPASVKVNINLIFDGNINVGDQQDEDNQTIESSSPGMRTSICSMQEMEIDEDEVDPEDYCNDFTPEINLYRGQYEKSAGRVEEPLMGQKRTFEASALGNGAFSVKKDGKRAKIERQQTIDEMLWDDESDFEEEIPLMEELPMMGNLGLRRTQASIFMDIRNKCLYL